MREREREGLTVRCQLEGEAGSKEDNDAVS